MAAPGADPDATHLSLATVSKPHGIRGAVRLAISPGHGDFLRTLPHVTLVPRGGQGERLHTRIASVAGTDASPIVTFEHVVDRSGSEQWRGATLEVARADLPPTGDDEYYLADLVGLEARRVADGSRIGDVAVVQDLPANAVLTIALDAEHGDHGRTLYAPFTREAVPTVDLDARYIEVDGDFLGLA